MVTQPPVGVEPYVRPSLRYRTLRALIVFGVVVVIGGPITWFVYANHYQPLGPGSYGIDVNPNLVGITDGVRTTGFIATGPTGSTSQYRTTMANWGHFDVRLLGLDSETGLKESVRWKVITQGADFDPTSPGWTSRPITVHPGQEVELAVDIVRPECDRGVISDGWPSIPIRWSALAVHHVYDLPFGGRDAARFYPCYPRTALAHVQR